MILNTKSRFLEKVNKQGGSGCWIWTATKNKLGYGSFWYGARMINAHRASFLIFSGKIPDGLHVLHTCDNPSCVNPDHLYLGTHQDNMRDKKVRGRSLGKGGVSAPKPWSSRPGEKNPNSKLTKTQVKEIKKLYETGNYTQSALGSMYGVSQATVYKIVHNKRWAKV